MTNNSVFITCFSYVLRIYLLAMGLVLQIKLSTAFPLKSVLSSKTAFHSLFDILVQECKE